MPDLSIRELAQKLNVSHTAVRNAIADIEAETGMKMGTSQGAGKAKLLSEPEQTLIAQTFYKPAAEDKPAASGKGEMVLSPGLTYGIPGLARTEPKQIQISIEEINAAKESYQESGQQAVFDAAQVVQMYARYRAAQTMAEIDATFEGIKASAINTAASELGKSGGQS